MSRLFVLGKAGLDIGLDLPGLPQPGETLVGRAADHILIVTLGAAGCRVTDGGGVTHYPAEAVTARDITDAGDTFCGVLAAALAVTRPGAFLSLPTAAELRFLLA
jgi:sugar/nucleoside kinase (ribokinase family)